MFEPQSRYARTEVKTYTDENAQQVAYIKRRFLPPAALQRVIGRQGIVEGDRLDLLAARHYGDATQHWRFTDAQQVYMDPKKLLSAPDTTITIVFPEPEA